MQALIVGRDITAWKTSPERATTGTVASHKARSLPAPFRSRRRELSVLSMNRMIALGAVAVVFAGAAAAPSIAERNRVGDLTWLEQQLGREPLTWSERDVDGTSRRVRLGIAELRRLELHVPRTSSGRATTCRCDASPAGGSVSAE